MPKFYQNEQTRKDNFRLLYLYSQYLNEHADFVTREMVEEIANPGGMSKEEAFLLLFTAALGLHPEDSTEDAIFCERFLRPSISHLDSATYQEDPYYQNIRIPTIRDGKWELKTETWQPYQVFICGDLQVFPDGRELPPLGYFSESFNFPAVLENEQEWMTVTPNEIETIRPGVRDSIGKVVTFGLGLGYYAYMAALKEEVCSVTVVEKDEAVIRLFQHYILPQFPQPEKISIIHADAFECAEKFMPAEHFDYAYADTWHDVGDGTPMYQRFKALEHLNPGTHFGYWEEKMILSYLRNQ